MHSSYICLPLGLGACSPEQLPTVFTWQSAYQVHTRCQYPSLVALQLTIVHCTQVHKHMSAWPHRVRLLHFILSYLTAYVDALLR